MFLSTSCILFYLCRICFLYANALLVGVDVSGDGARMALKLNPGKDTIIESGYIGYFIAQSLEDVRKYGQLLNSAYCASVCWVK